MSLCEAKMADASPVGSDPLVEMVNVTKRFAHVVANDRVSFEVHRGEVLGLIGENGAGKTTLMNILFGLYKADGGTIKINGTQADIRSPAHAISLGLGMVHQHFKLVRSFTVSENLALGLPQARTPFLDLRLLENRVKELGKSYAMPVDPRARIWQLSVGEQQRVEILDLLLRNAQVLILDEPTAVLAPAEVSSLFGTLRAISTEGRAVIFITHKLREVTEIADRVVVLRKGRVVGRMARSDMDERHLAELMVGRERVEPQARYSHGASEEEAIRVDGLTVRGDRGTYAVRGATFGVRRGEILGVAGVDGNGQREMCEAIVGVRSIESGEIRVRGQAYDVWDCRAAIKAGIGYIPEDRQRVGLVLSFPIWRNLLLKQYREAQFRRLFLLHPAAIFAFARDMVSQYDIRVVDYENEPARNLSGGNQQKLVLARELSCSPGILVANQPCRGLDIAATGFVHSQLVRVRNAGGAVLLVSRELDEVLGLSDRVAVMYGGEIRQIMDAAQATPDRVGTLMSGADGA